MKKLRDRVLRLLRTKPETRKSYKLLCILIWTEELAKYNLQPSEFLWAYGSDHYHLTSSGSITRCARALFKEFPELVDEDADKIRREYEETMRRAYSSRTDEPSNRYNQLGEE